MSRAETYVTAAYLVVLATLLAYVVIMALKLGRMRRELDELAELARTREAPVERERAEAAVG